MGSFQTDKKVIAERIEKLEKLSGQLSLRLRHTSDLDWGTTRGVATSLRWLLGMVHSWLVAKFAVSEAGSGIYGAQSEVFKQEAISPAHELARKSGGGFGRSWAEGEQRKLARSLAGSVPNIDQLQEFLALRARYVKQLDNLDTLFCSFHELYRTMPAYMEIKKLLPSGSRNALSALLAYDTGKLDDTLAKSHELFGWHLTDRERRARGTPDFSGTCRSRTPVASGR
jgi:hypothetical protein